jgi:hypothetical protein
VLTALLFVFLELLAGQVIEPLVYGHSSGLSPVAVILSAIISGQATDIAAIVESGSGPVPKSVPKRAEKSGCRR